MCLSGEPRKEEGMMLERRFPSQRNFQEALSEILKRVITKNVMINKIAGYGCCSLFLPLQGHYPLALFLDASFGGFPANFGVLCQEQEKRHFDF